MPGTICIRMKAQLCYLCCTGEGGSIQRLDVRQLNLKLEPFKFNPPVDDCFKHEAVGGTERKAEGKLHSSSMILTATSEKLRIAMGRFHAARFRFSASKSVA